MADSSGKLNSLPSNPRDVGRFIEIGPSQKQEASGSAAEAGAGAAANEREPTASRMARRARTIA